jgi:hypothetical protein
MICEDFKPAAQIETIKLNEGDVGVFGWFHHPNTPTFTLNHGNSQRAIQLTMIQRIDS